MKKTYQEILDVLKEQFEGVEDFAYASERNFEGKGLGKVIEIEQVGGEGEGEHWHVVFHFVDHDVYIKVTGFYSSYNGTDFYDGWDCCENVKPQQRTITVYEA